MNEDLVNLVAVTAELCGTQMSKPAAKLLAEELAEYDPSEVQKALQKCRRELKGRLTMQEVISRIDDGRPGAEEAWAMLVWDEELTCVLTDEMNLAQGIARQVYYSDKVAARMAFKEAYTRLVAEARNGKVPVSWWPSLGWDADSRTDVINRAIDEGKLIAARVQHLIPAGTGRSGIPDAGFARIGAVMAAIEAPFDEEKEAIRERRKREVMAEIQKTPSVF